MTAPLGSVIVPLIEPRVDCAYAADTVSQTADNA
jgi:hypothetical protein